MHAMRRFTPSSSPRAQRGVSLIEVLIAVLIMGVGLLGIAAMQATALRNSQSALERSQAVIMSYAILDAMRANRDAAIGGAYNTAMTCAAPTAGTLAQNDVRQWIISLKEAVRGTDLAAADTTACGSVTCGVGNLCTVTVQWDDSRATNTRASNADGSSATNRSVVTSAVL
jgi:type IV pilus assembly protein PilV